MTHACTSLLLLKSPVVLILILRADCVSSTSLEECSAADKERSWSLLAQDYITLQLL